MDIDYTPSKICKEFMMSNAKMRTLMGPVGSGKSVAFKYVTNDTNASHSIQGLVVTFGVGDRL